MNYKVKTPSLTEYARLASVGPAMRRIAGEYAVKNESNEIRKHLPHEVRQMLHELHIHQVWLEEELGKTQV